MKTIYPSTYFVCRGYNNYTAQTMGKSRPDCTQPAQSARYSQQYFDNICRIKSNCAQHLPSASNNLKVFIHQSRCATCHFGICTENKQINNYNKIKYHSPKQEAHGPLFAHMIKTAIACLQMPCNFFQYCHSN